MDIINKILVYIGELNDELYITQYHTVTNDQYYKVNYHADVLWGIRATITAKRIYPCCTSGQFWSFTKMQSLYSHAKPHYEKKLRNGEDI